jgi:hypothetical protein
VINRFLDLSEHVFWDQKTSLTLKIDSAALKTKSHSMVRISDNVLRAESKARLPVRLLLWRP